MTGYYVGGGGREETLFILGLISFKYENPYRKRITVPRKQVFD
jgi:hypothetical protein